MIASVAPFVFLLLCYSESELTQAVELKYAVFFTSEGFDSTGAIPAIELAEEMVNNNNSILPGYTLTHTGVMDTKCDRAKSLELFFETISPPNPPVLGLLGCGCSVASTPVAEIVHYKSMSQVSYTSSSVELDDGARFPNFFRTRPSDADFTPVFLSVVKQYGWKRVTFLNQDEKIFTEVFERLTEPAAEMNLTLKNRLFPSEFPIKGLTSENFFFEDEDYRVFVVNTYSNYAQHIVCEAYKRGYMYPNYAWIVLGWFEDDWWTQGKNPSSIDCTDDQLGEFLHRTLAILVFAVASDEDAVTDTQLTAKQFSDLYRAQPTSNYTLSRIGTLSYDALWTLAFALDDTNKMISGMARDEVLNITGCPGRSRKTDIYWELVPLENFTNDNELMGCVIRWNLQRTDFIGVSGRVLFNDAGTRFQGHSQIFQYRFNESSVILQRDYIARTDYQGNKAMIVFLNGESEGTVFPESEGGVPLDGTPINQINSYHWALVGIYYLLATLGIVFSTVCLVFNFTQRKKKIVRLTSPNLNYFLIAGTYLMFLSVFCRLIPSTSYSANYARCILDVVVDTIGYCLAFGVVLAKMGRIYYIFNNPTTNKQSVKDWKLILATLAVAGFGTLLVILQLAIPQFRPDPELISDPEAGVTVNEDSIRINHFFYTCFSDESQASTWIIVIFLYLALLQVIGIVLAVQTRKVKVKVLNDSKHIAALIYISSIVLVTRAVAVFAVSHLLNVAEVIFSGGIIVLGFAFLSIVFIPKMVSLIQDPEGDKIFATEKAGETELSVWTDNGGRKKDNASDQSSKVEQLEARVAELENMLGLKQTRDLEMTEKTAVENNGVVLPEAHQTIKDNTLL